MDYLFKLRYNVLYQSEPLISYIYAVMHSFKISQHQPTGNLLHSLLMKEINSW